MTQGHAGSNGAGNQSPPYNRTQLLIILLTPLLVMASATALYFSGWLVPTERVNNGELIDPVMQLSDLGLELETINPERQWLWIQTSAQCQAQCLEEVARQRQIHVALGKHEPRVRRVLLTATPDLENLSGEFPGMTVVQQAPGAFSDTFRSRIPADFGQRHFIFVADPIGNVMLYFTPANDYKEQLEDMKKLLKLSTIG